MPIDDSQNPDPYAIDWNRVRAGVQSAKDAWNDPRMSEWNFTPRGIWESTKAAGRFVARVGQIPFEVIDSAAQQEPNLPTSQWGVQSRPAPATVSPINGEAKDVWGPMLQALYGHDGEHWDETASQMQQDPSGDGLDRLHTWAYLIQNDPVYKPRYDMLARTIKDPEALWNTAIGEYKEARKADASVAWDPASTQVAMMVLPEARALGRLGGAVAAGKVGLGEAAVAAGMKVSGGEALLQLGKGAKVLGTEGAAYAGKILLKTGGATGRYFFPNLAPKVVEAATKLQATPLWTTAAREARGWATVGKTAVKAIDGAVDFPSYGELAARAGITPEVAPAWAATAGGGALWGAISSGGEAGAIGAGAALGAALPGVLSRPGALRQAAVGALAGYSAGRLTNRMTGTEDADTYGAWIGALGGVGAGALWKAFGAPSFMRDLIWKSTGDLNGVGRVLVRYLPQADVANIVAGSPHPEVAAELARTWQLRDTQLKLADESRQRMYQRVMEAVGDKANDYEWRKNVLRPALQATGRGAQSVDYWQLLGKDPSDPEMKRAMDAARGVRLALDDWFNELTEAGIIKPSDYIDHYIPLVLDKPKFWKMFTDLPEGKNLMSPAHAATLHTAFFDSLGDFHQPITIAGKQYNGMRALLYDNPDMFFQNISRKADGWYFTPTGDRLKYLDDTRIRELESVRLVSKAVGVHPGTAINILRNYEEPQFTLLGSRLSPERLPENLLLPHALERAGSNLPFVDDPLDSIVRYVEKSARKMYLEPLVKSMEVELPNGRKIKTTPLLQSLDDTLRRQHAEGLRNFIVEDLRNLMGMPKKEGDGWSVERFLEDFAFKLHPDAPGQGRIASRMILESHYLGALGFAPGKAIRNLWGGLLTSTHLGGDYFSSGLVEFHRAPEKYTKMAAEFGALRNFAPEITELARLNEASTFGKVWKKFSSSGLKMFRDADDFMRSRSFTAGYMKAAAEREATTFEGFRKSVAGRLEALQAEAIRKGTPEAWHRFAGEFGARTADLTQWVYGKEGAPLAFQGPGGAIAGAFLQWPINYASLLTNWMAQGQHRKIVNMTLAASIIDRLARDELGINRFTGLSGQGQNSSSGFDIPSPFSVATIAPQEAISAPIAAAGAVVGVGMALLDPSNPAVADVGRSIEHNLFLPGQFGLNWYRALRELEDGEPRRALYRAIGYTPTKEE